MRCFILSFLIIGLFAAEPIQPRREDFTLNDGRLLTGIYNEESGTLTLDGGKMSLHITADQIKERAPAKEAATSGAVKELTPEEKAERLESQKRKQVADLLLDAVADDKKAAELRAEAKGISNNLRIATEEERRKGSKQTMALESQASDLNKTAAAKREAAKLLAKSLTPSPAATPSH